VEPWSWQPAGPPSTQSLPVELIAHEVTTGWQTAMHRHPKIRLRQIPCNVASPRTFSIAVSRRKVRTFSYTFPDASGASAVADSWKRHDSSDTDDGRAVLPFGPVTPPAVDSASARKDDASAVPHSQTRIRPPGDIVKMADRLYYLLQPPLESLFVGRSLRFPFTPFPYQFGGIAFLYPRYSAVLADEMGLGKTMQAITTIRLLLASGEVTRILLVCPKPLVTNWQREFAMWAPEIPLAVIEGDQVRRRWQWSLPQAPVKIANYEILVRDREALLDPDLKFDLVVLDEAQRIKNRSSTTSEVVRSIHRVRSWALTGTPVENSSEDLRGIFEFLAPGYLRAEMTPRELGRSVGDYVLRRTKDRVLSDLPPKMFRDAQLDLSPAQQATYERAESDGVVRLSDLGDELTVQHVFELVLRLKQICNFDPPTGESSKLERLVVDLEEIAASGEKAIVFSQWVQTLTTLRRRCAPFGCLEYHGKIPMKRRDRVIDQFKNDPHTHVILMSYGAGGVGLNLQFCRYVFLFDRWWNPAVEDQAINRAHRIGVAGPVTVTRFLMLGTIEERIDQILTAKRELFEAILSHAHGPAKLGMSQEEIFGLFSLSTPKGPLKMAA
jgi:SNF2 family DNA or RNA helicase